eukprot:364914-Chlamydomonas_euryale.AAC.10
MRNPRRAAFKRERCPSVQHLPLFSGLPAGPPEAYLQVRGQLHCSSAAASITQSVCRRAGIDTDRATLTPPAPAPSLAPLPAAAAPPRAPRTCAECRTVVGAPHGGWKAPHGGCRTVVGVPHGGWRSCQTSMAGKSRVGKGRGQGRREAGPVDSDKGWVGGSALQLTWNGKE